MPTTNERFDDYCNKTVTGSFTEPLRLTTSSVGILSSLITITFVFAGRGCGKAVHRFFLIYGTFAALLSGSQLMTALSCRPQMTKDENAEIIYSAFDCTSCYFRFALYLIVSWISIYIFAAGMCGSQRLLHVKIRPVKLGVVLVVLGLPLSCVWRPIYMVLNCKGTTTGKCNAAFAIATAFVSAESVLHITSVALVTLIAAMLVRGFCTPAEDGQYKKTFMKLTGIFAAMTVTFLIYVVDLIVTVTMLVSKNRGKALSLPFYVLDALPLVGIALVPLAYFCLLCDKSVCWRREDPDVSAVTSQ